MRNWLSVALFVMVAVFLAGCDGSNSGSGPKPKTISFSGLTANGESETETTTQLTLTFSDDPTTLTIDNINLTGATKGELSGTGNTRTLTISNISVGNGETVSLSISNPAGYKIEPTSLDTTVYVKAQEIEFSGLTANGTSETETTTQLTLTFSDDPATLTIDNINLTGATKGELSGTGNTRTLTISNISVGNGGALSLSINNPAGYKIEPTSLDTTVYVKAQEIEFSGLTANGTSETETTTQLTLTFSDDPATLTIDNINLTGATKGELSGTGNTRTLTISNISVGNGETVSLSISNPAGYKIEPTSLDTTVYVKAQEIEFSGLTANGTSETETTTQLTLTFSDDPATLTIDNINLTGATKGELSGTGNTRTLTISNISVGNGGALSLSINNPAGYKIEPTSLDTTVYVKAQEIEFSGLTANGTSETETTTQLTLTFSDDPATLTIDNINLTGATKGELSGTGNTRTLTISNISVGNGGALSLSINNPAGYKIEPTSLDTTVYVKAQEIEFSGLTANGTSETETTTQLTLTFSDDPTTLTIDNINLTGATKGELSGTGNIRTLTISNISVGNGGTVSLSINNPAGYKIEPTSLDTTVYVKAQEIEFSGLTANGTSETETTTQLTLTFSDDPTTLTVNNINLTGATKGELSGTGNTRTLTISDILVGNGGTVSLSINNPAGYKIEPDSLDTTVYVAETAGLEFTLINGGTSYEVSKGTATAQNIIIPAKHGLLPVTKIAEDGFAEGNLRSIEIPSSVTIIGNNAFGSCAHLNNVFLPNSVTTISESAFSHCTNLANIILPYSLTTIGSYAFNDCTALNTITLHHEVTSIGERAFSGCSALTTINVEAMQPPTLGTDAFLNDSSLLSIYVPPGSLFSYRNAPEWINYASIINSL